MIQIWKKIKMVGNMFVPKSTASVIVSLLGSLGISYFILSFAYPDIYKNQLVITELFSGTSVFKNYYKPGDFQIPRYFMLMSLLLFFFLSLCTNIYKAKKDFIKPIHIFMFFFCGVLILQKYFGMDIWAGGILLLALIPPVLISYSGYSKMKESDKIRADKNMDWILCIQIMVYFSLRLCMQLGLMFEAVTENKAKMLFPVMSVIGYGVSLVFLLFARKGICGTARKVYCIIVQIILCLMPLLLLKFPIRYNGSMESFSYSGLRIAGIALSCVMFVYLLFRVKRKKAVFLSSSFMAIGAMQILFEYENNMFEPISLFHYGELTVPMEQLLEFGKIPFLNFFPIHGMCDYFFQLCNQIFLDGCYTSFGYAYYVGSMLLCALAALVYYKCLKTPSAAMMFIVFFSVIGEWYYYFRFIFVLPVLFILFHKTVREDLIKTIWAYISTSILSIAWYPAIGGALAVALLPAVMIRGKRNWKKCLAELREPKYRKQQYWWYFPLFMVGSCFIPMFMGILRYLKENMEISDYFPGDRLSAAIKTEELKQMFQISNPWENTAFLLFAFFIPLMLLLFWSFYKRVRHLVLEACLVSFLFSYFICSYTFGTVFKGERSLIVAMILLAFFGVIVIWENGKERLPVFLAAGSMVFAVSLNSFQVLESQEKYLSYEQIPKEYVKVRGKELGYQRMGDGYMPKEMKENLKDMAFVVNELCDEGETYMDFTNLPALYVMLEKRTPFAYTCLYHGTSSETQKNMLKEIKKDTPWLVLVSPYWQNDGGPISLKNKEIYQYFMEEGYVPYSYHSICFMLPDWMNCPDWAEDGMELFLEAMRASGLQGLPVAWGNAELNRTFYKTEGNCQVVNANSISIKKENIYTVTGDDPYLVLKADDELMYERAEYLKINFYSSKLEEQENKTTNMMLYLSYEDGSYSEKRGFSFEAQNGSMLVPLYFSPLWTKYHFGYIRLDIEDERLLDTDFSLSYEFAGMEEDEEE